MPLMAILTATAGPVRDQVLVLPISGALPDGAQLLQPARKLAAIVPMAPLNTPSARSDEVLGTHRAGRDAILLTELFDTS